MKRSRPSEHPPSRQRYEKVSVVYDENARKEWLDFRKRKNQRRKVAQTANYEREKETNRQEKLERREASRSAAALQTETIVLPLVHHLTAGGGGGEGSQEVDGEEAFEDDFTRQAFGEATVVVTTRQGLDEGEEGQHLERETRERLRELAAPILEAQRLRREAEARALETRRRVAATEKAAKAKKKFKNWGGAKGGKAAKGKKKGKGGGGKGK